MIDSPEKKSMSAITPLTLLREHHNTSYKEIHSQVRTFSKALKALPLPKESSRVTLKDEEEARELLNERTFTIICPIPMPENREERLLHPKIQISLNEAFECYLNLRQLPYIKVASMIHTVMVLDSDLDEMKLLARLFFQEFFLHSEKGENQMFFPREPERKPLSGQGWHLSEPEEDSITLPLGDGNKISISLNLPQE